MRLCKNWEFSLKVNNNTMQWNELIGYIGAFLSAITFIPQVWQAWKTKSVGDLSIWMIFIVITSTIVWLIYAFSVNSGPVIAANIILC